MSSGIIKADKDINTSTAIIKAVVDIGKFVVHRNDVKEQLQDVKQETNEYDVQLSQIYDAIENLLDKKKGSAKKMGRIGKRPDLKLIKLDAFLR